MEESTFLELSKINVNAYVEKKNGLSYLSWAYAWGEVKKRYPDADYTIIGFGEHGLPYQFVPGLGYMCWTEVTIQGEKKTMWLPVMDGANKAMLDKPYEYTVKNPNFKWAKLDKETGKYIDKYGNEQTEYITKTCEAATMFDINKTIMRCLVKNLAMFGLGLYIYAGEDLPEDADPETSAGFEGIKKEMCADCGKVITDDFIAQGTKKAYGRFLCRECGMKAKKELNNG